MECCICEKQIESGNYYYDVYGNVAHGHHSNVEYCPVCRRLIGTHSSNGKVKYSDKRYICGYCDENESPVKEIRQLNRSYFEAITLLKEKGFDFPSNIKVFLVSQDVFTELGYAPTTLGLNVTKKSYSKVQSHEISVLWGLPYLLCTGVLAHELLHVWQNTKGLKPDNLICEGMCELGSGLVYKRNKTKLGQVLFDSIEKNMELTYSDGFKFMKTLLENQGWNAVKQYVSRNSVKQKSFLFHL